MKLFQSAKITCAAFGMTTILATGAFAASHGDMTCGDLMNMSEEDQMAAVVDLGAAHEATTDGNMADGGGDSMVDDATDGGRENAREEATGADMMAMVMEQCEGNPDMQVKAAIHPTEKTE